MRESLKREGGPLAPNGGGGEGATYVGLPQAGDEFGDDARGADGLGRFLNEVAQRQPRAVGEKAAFPDDRAEERVGRH